MKFRKKPVIIDATQWFKNGDHPLDNATEMFDYPVGQRPVVIREGSIVRYYRRPDVSDKSLCEQCGETHLTHGWIDTLEQGHRVCPGDWIITGVKGEMYPCKPNIFELTYDRIGDEATCTDNAEIYTCSENVSKKEGNVDISEAAAVRDQAIRECVAVVKGLDGGIFDNQLIVNTYETGQRNALIIVERLLTRLIGTPVIQGDKP